MCVHICQRWFVKYIVSVATAYMQVVRRHHGDAEDRPIPVCCDSDEIAYDNLYVIIVDCWPREEYRIINLNRLVVEKTNNFFPLFYYYLKYEW